MHISRSEHLGFERELLPMQLSALPSVQQRWLVDPVEDLIIVKVRPTSFLWVSYQAIQLAKANDQSPVRP